MKLLRSLTISGLSLSLAIAVAAQTKQTPPNMPPSKVAAEKPAAKSTAETKEAESKERKETEAGFGAERQQRGLGLVREAAQEAAGFEDKRSAARVQALAA